MPVVPNTEAITLSLEVSYNVDTLLELQQNTLPYLNSFVLVLETQKIYRVARDGSVNDTAFTKFDEAQRPQASSNITDNFVVTQLILDAKQVTLSRLPADPLKVEFATYHGPEQRAGVDFVVMSNILSWDSLALEILLELNDAFAVRYSI